MQDSDVRMPRWARSTFRDFIDYWEMLGEVLELTIGGISVVRLTPNFVPRTRQDIPRTLFLST